MPCPTETSESESPACHGDILRETEQRYEAGVERPIDWDTAKRELRESMMFRARVKKASVPFHAADHLRSEAEIVAYVEAMLVDGDDRVLPIALRTVCNALLRLQRSRKAK